VDVTAASGIAYSVGITPPATVVTQVEDVTVGGAAAGDCDGDGDIDLFITGGDAGSGANRLYLNQLYLNRQGQPGPPLRFVDTAGIAGVAYTRDAALSQNFRHSGPTFADLDGDGDLDLFLGGLFGDPNRIYANDGDCRFTDVTPPAIEAMEAPHTISAGFGDYDLDGDLDMFLTHWATRDSTYQAYLPVWHTEHLWQNRGNFEFVNVSRETNVSDITRTTRDHLDPFDRVQEIDYTFTPTFARVDADVWPDIAIAGDFGTSQLLLGNGDGTFRDSAYGTILREAHNGMGSSLGDFDNDGDLDWFVTSINNNTVQLNGNRFYRNLENGTGTFDLADQTMTVGVWQGGWGWASCFLDIDNDRDLDIYHVNGWELEFLGLFYTDDRSVAFVQNGGTYINQAAALGLDDQLSGRGVVCADFDDDGDVDILQLTNRQPSSGVLRENRTAASGRNFLRVKLRGLTPNTEAAGARVYVTAGGTTQMREITVGSNYTSQNPTVQYFGLGAAATFESVRIIWPARVPGPGLAPVQPTDTVLPNAMQPAIGVNRTLVITQAL
jgi:hypothetical protein